MSKKIIAILTIATILFVCVFAACEKEDPIYIDDDEYVFVTDENGEKVLAEDGRLMVYETDKRGKIVKDDNGEPITYPKQFQPIENDGVIEDYGYKLALPEGWKSTAEYNVFINPEKEYECEISVVKYFYDDYYSSNKYVYALIRENKGDVTWEEDLDFGEEYKGICRMYLKTPDGDSVMYFFENAGNVYKLLFTGKGDSLVAGSESFCKAMNFKPFAYYDDITKKPTTTEAATQKPVITTAEAE